MWPFKNARDKPAANSPDYGKMRNVNRNWNRNYALLSMLDLINKLV